MLVEPGEKRAPGRIGEGGKGAVEDGVLKVNHNVKCYDRHAFLSRTTATGYFSFLIISCAAAGLRTLAPEMK